MNAPRVKDVTLHWGEQPPEPSVRLTEWVEKIKAGWRPNRRIHGLGYHESAEWYGVYIWEYLNVLMPLIREMEGKDDERARLP